MMKTVVKMQPIGLSITLSITGTTNAALEFAELLLFVHVLVSPLF